MSGVDGSFASVWMMACHANVFGWLVHESHTCYRRDNPEVQM